MTVLCHAAMHVLVRSFGVGIGFALLSACRSNEAPTPDATPHETSGTSSAAVVGVASPREPFFLDGGAINRSVMESNVTFRGVRSLKGRGTSSRP